MPKTSRARERLIGLFQEVYELTEPECHRLCRIPQSCCSPEYCEEAIRHAKEDWGVVLERAGHKVLPLMGPTGCTAAPHFRPLCALHTCKMNGLGVLASGDKETKKYFSLRRRIEGLLYLIHCSSAAAQRENVV